MLFPPNSGQVRVCSALAHVRMRSTRAQTIPTLETALISMMLCVPRASRCCVGVCCAGDGKYHELQLKVTSYSIEEDWVMGVSYLQYEYPTPYAKKEPLYEIDGMPLHYMSSPDDKDSTQPFKTVPWMVEFKGCCRWYEGMTDEDVKPDNMLNFNIRATVDLSNHVASPRLVSLPFIYIKPQLSTLLPVCALSAGGKAAMVRKNGGTINYPADDNTTAQFVWSAKGYSTSIEGSTDSKDGRCAVLTLGLQPKYLSENRDFVTIEVRMGDAMVTGDYAIYVKDPGLISNQQNARSPFGCMMNSACEGELSLSKRMPIFVGAPWRVPLWRSATSLLRTRINQPCSRPPF